MRDSNPRGLHLTRSPSQQIEVSDDSTTGPTQRLTDWMRFVASGPVRRPLLLGLPVEQPILVFGSAVQGERSESRSDGVAALDRRAEDQTIHRRGGRVLHRHTGPVHLALTA